jgi:DNA-binding MarR family transcriptional regulator
MINKCNNIFMAEKQTERHPKSVAFLLAQVGHHAAREFAAALAPIDLAPQHAGILRALSHKAGVSQQDLARMLGMHASRLVAVLDELESRGLIAREGNTDDRRTYALRLTEKGRGMLAEIGRIARRHDQRMCESLSEAEREQLSAWLQRIADQQGLTPGVHPGFSRSGARAES